jgi:hypothetical protein
MAILRVILIIVAVYYIIRILDRYIVPFLFGKPEDKKKREPRITQTGKPKKRFSKEDGEYVDFEEIEPD